MLYEVITDPVEVEDLGAGERLVARVPDGPSGVRRAQSVSQVDLARTIESLARSDSKLPGAPLRGLPAGAVSG